MGEKKNIYKIARKLKGKRPSGRCKHRWEGIVR
jgi:hypothetical protein